MRGLYAIVDVEFLRSRGTDPVAYGLALLEARPCALQVRAKKSSDSEFIAVLRFLAPLCAAVSVPLIANDRADLARITACAGVHLGQGDEAPESVRRTSPGLSIGLSTHTREQLEQAFAKQPSYVAFGPIFGTSTKLDAEPSVGLEELGRASKLAHDANIPLVAIGGISLSRAAEVAAYHTGACAVISGLYPAGATLAGVTARAREFQAALLG